MNAQLNSSLGFEALGLPQTILDTLGALGHDTPTPIQERTIPPLLEGKDLLGQALTGTGKTAAFALPLLTHLDPQAKPPQVLVLTPTRELAIQVAESISAYARGMKGVQVLPIFGGQDYGIQFRGLARGAHVVVGPPGRVMDHMRKGTLNLSALQALVLDEADEMLRMGFIEDVEWILEQTPAKRQIALFSATMPPRIRHIARKHLKDPVEVSIEKHSRAAMTIAQRFCLVPPAYKTEALVRILEFEDTDGVIVFARTKVDTVTLAESLVKAGYRAAALNGDLAQAQRERTVGKLKSGLLDILVATDVAARGLDLNRISHVINYDPPSDAESYVHRIGRTGRAGREGKAILLLFPREQHTLRYVEQTTHQKIEKMALPSADALNQARIAHFDKEIGETLAGQGTGVYREIIQGIIDADEKRTPFDVAVALAAMLRGNKPLLVNELPTVKSFRDSASHSKTRRSNHASNQGSARRRPGDENMERYRVQIGSTHGLTPSHLVGVIANEACLSSKFIGKIEIHDTYSIVDLHAGMSRETLAVLQKVKVFNRPLGLLLDSGRPEFSPKGAFGPRGKKRRASTLKGKRAAKKKFSPKGSFSKKNTFAKKSAFPKKAARRQSLRAS